MIELKTEYIYPVGNRLLIEPYKQAAETTAGLILSEGDGYATPVIGTVIRTGSGVTDYAEGDVIAMRRYSVDSLKVYTEEGEKEIYLLEASEVIAVVREAVGPPQKRGDYSAINELKDAQQRGTQESDEEGKESPSEESKEG